MGLARLLGLSPRTVAGMAAAQAWRHGALPAPTYVGDSVRSGHGRGRRWRVAEVEAWLLAGQDGER